MVRLLLRVGPGAGIEGVVGPLVTASKCGRISARWGVCGAQVAEGGGDVKIDALCPTGLVYFRASAPELTCADDAATLPPISLPASSLLTTAVQYPGIPEDVVRGDTAVYSVSPASAAVCELFDSGDGAVSVRAAPGATCPQGECVLSVSFPVFEAECGIVMAANVTVDVVKVLCVNSYVAEGPCDGELPAALLASPPTCAAPASFESRQLSCSAPDFWQGTHWATAVTSASRRAPGGASPVSTPPPWHLQRIAALLTQS